jgi:hypothetical protein
LNFGENKTGAESLLSELFNRPSSFGVGRPLDDRFTLEADTHVAIDPKGPFKRLGVWGDHQARDRRDASTLDILATPQFRKRAQKSDRDDGQNELRNDSR